MALIDFLKRLFSKKNDSAEPSVSSEVVIEQVSDELETQTGFNTDSIEELGGVIVDEEENDGEDELNG